MMKEHITFGMLSDLHDEMMSAARKESVMDHLSGCPACGREFELLGRMVRMVSCLRVIGIRSGNDFARATMSRVLLCERKRKKHLYYKRVIPSAVAAMVIFMVGIDQFQNGPSGERRGGARIATNAGSGEVSREIGSAYDMRRTMSILRKNRARVTMVTDGYIEAEAPSRSVDDIQRECDGSYSTGMHGFATAVGYTEGGMQDSLILSSGFMHQRPADQSRTVRFRVLFR
ncbi:MAG TPA: zf-HC2 domain-containing protein [Spirochaetota bacterium]|nr:zf-HC2 domain-containing protein [Spirochaetota bacterium]